ncbi:hypothetical protein ABEB36_004329 [Hypothenemus hampei]|uniref:endo-polygalacturonase n=1 Tax=Hypothenemus hampei TaxID=57062 RepID=A0ABD1F313_HYPHA
MFNSQFNTFFFFLINVYVKIHAQDNCAIKTIQDVSKVTSTCQNINIEDLVVPAGETLTLDLIEKATVTLKGNITFGYVNWIGPLMRVYGSNVTIKGEKGHVLNGQGELYWDSLGSWGSEKPKFLIVEVTNDSLFDNLFIYHAPMHGIAINNSHDVTFSNILIDNAAGAENVALYGHAGHNTDGFGVNMSTNVIIRDSVIYNQDDCVVLNSGSRIHVYNMLCHGSHGLSLSVGFSNETIALNTLTDVVIENSTIIDAMDGIHVKTHIDAGKGQLTNVTYRNINILGSYSYGIAVEQNYTNSATPGNGAIPLNNIPITKLKFTNIKGTVQNQSVPYYVVCAQDGCLNWEWNEINIYGNKESVCVNFHPNSISCIDYIVEKLNK